MQQTFPAVGQLAETLPQADVAYALFMTWVKRIQSRGRVGELTGKPIRLQFTDGTTSDDAADTPWFSRSAWT